MVLAPKALERAANVLDEMRQTLTVRTVTPDEYATLVAEDRHLASEFAQLCTVGDTVDALQVVSEEAEGILAFCERMSATIPSVRNLSLLMSLKVIEEVAEQSDQLGDEVQASWCKLLNHKLLGGVWPPI
jgi:hypothetical protein